MLFKKHSQSSRLPWKQFSIEAVLVVLSVLLALALNSWRESRAHEDLAQQALQGVLDEVQINCSRIESVQDYHRRVVDGEAEPEGIQIGFLRNDAWDVAKSTGAAVHLDHEIAAKTGELSARQWDHRAIIQAYVQALFTIALQAETEEQWHREGGTGRYPGVGENSVESARKLSGTGRAGGRAVWRGYQHGECMRAAGVASSGTCK